MTTGKMGAFEKSPLTAWALPESRLGMPGRSGAQVSLEGRRALVVEDSWHIAVAMKLLLENAGLVVVGPAARSDAAKELLAGGGIDVAVVDVNLHGTLALDLVDRLNELEIPVIVVSGYERLDELDGKIAAFLTKPVRSRVLISALRKALAPQVS